MKRTYWFIVGMLLLSSCHKDIDREREEKLPQLTEETYELANQEIEINQLVEALNYNIDVMSLSVEQEARQTKAKPVCPEISIDFEGESLFPNTITVDFEDGCKGKREHDISGIMRIASSSHWFEVNSTRTVSLENFEIDGVLVSGSQTITYDGMSNGVLNFAISGNLRFTWSSGFWVDRHLESTRSYISGLLSNSTELESYLIEASGTVTDVTSTGNTFEKVTQTPIVYNSDCQYIVSGLVDVYKNDDLKFTLDYGDGECDRYATISIGDESGQLNLNSTPN